MSERTYQDWVVVFRTGTDYEADIVRDRLDDAGIKAVVLTQRDHAFNLTVGDLAPVNVLVPPESVSEAAAILDAKPLTDAELNEAAMNSNPAAPDAHDQREESILDSGIEEIHLSPPDEDDEELDR